jgi:hypothetical protein
MSRTIVQRGWTYIVTVLLVLGHKFYSHDSQGRYSVPMAPTGCPRSSVTIGVRTILQDPGMFLETAAVNFVLRP